MQENTNHLKALFPEKDKNIQSYHSRSWYLPEEWDKMQKKKQEKRYKQEKNNLNLNHPQHANQSAPVNLAINKEKYQVEPQRP